MTVGCVVLLAATAGADWRGGALSGAEWDKAASFGTPFAVDLHAGTAGEFPATVRFMPGADSAAPDRSAAPVPQFAELISSPAGDARPTTDGWSVAEPGLYVTGENLYLAGTGGVTLPTSPGDSHQPWSASLRTIPVPAPAGVVLGLLGAAALGLLRQRLSERTA